MEIFSSPPSQTPVTTRILCTPRFAAFPFTAVIILLLSLTAAARRVRYSDHCNDVVREPLLLPDPNPPLTDPSFLVLRHAHVDWVNKDISVIPKSLSFETDRAYKTQKNAVFEIESSLRLHGVGYFHNSSLRGSGLVNSWQSAGGSMHRVTFLLGGFWDSISGKLCMVGPGLGILSSNHVVLKLDYLNTSNIFSSLVNGTLESLDVNNETGFHLKQLSILGVNPRNYMYGLIDKESEIDDFRLTDDTSSVSLAVQDLVKVKGLCRYIQAAKFFELEYKSDCNSVNCNFLGRGINYNNSNSNNNNLMPSVMYMSEIECLEDGRVRLLLEFGDSGKNEFLRPFKPNATLVSEGKWDAKQKRLNMVGCRILNDWDKECLIRLCLRFPAKWNLRDRSIVVGELWSSRSVNETGYFGRVMLSSKRNNDIRAPGMRYDYTELDKAKRSCANKITRKGERKMYPKPLSYDMRFDVFASNKKVTGLSGKSSPLFVGSQHYYLLPPSIFGRQHQNLSNLLNVSYGLNVTTSHDFKLSSVHKKIQSFDISAEGTYNSESGHVCMIGCMQVGPPKVSVGRSLDCEIVVDIQYHPVNTNNGETVKGTIKSTREKSDGLYFEPFEITSRLIYQKQVWRMDLEITMVLISNTLSFIFVGLQLLHVKRHANVLPLISVVMLIVLTLGHLIPLLLNFEALFTRRRNSGDEWLEVNEVLVRVITMIAFLLKFRLLQMAWSSRSADEGQKNLWTPDKKVLYIGGALIAWFVHLWREPYESPQVTHRFGYKKPSLWGDLKSYGGLILDGFLLPQILFNLFCDSKEKVLAPSFYVGTSVVRLLPHAYDLYRSHSSTWSFRNIYANPRLDYYSTAWDIIISVGGFLCVVLIYLQQRYGGQCLIPRRLWRGSTYEKVPVAGPE